MILQALLKTFLIAAAVMAATFYAADMIDRILKGEDDYDDFEGI